MSIKKTLKKPFAIMAIIMAVILAVVLVVLFMRKPISVKWILGEKDAHYPTFFAEHVIGQISRTTLLYSMNEKSDIKKPSETIEAYQGFYPENVLDQFDGEITFEKYGQLLYYDEYDMGQILVFDNWQQNTENWEIVLVDNTGNIREYSAQRIGRNTTPSDYVLTNQAIYLHVTSQTSLNVIEIDIETGEQTLYSTSLAVLGIKSHEVCDNRFYFDADEQKFIVIAFDTTDYTKIIQYDIKSETATTLHTKQPVSDVIKTQNKYYLVNNRVLGELNIYSVNYDFYDFKEIAIPFTQIQKSNVPMDRSFSWFRTHYVEGVLYGLFAHVEDDAYYFYSVDIKSESLKTLAKIKTGDFEIIQYKLYSSINNKSPYSTMQ